MPINHLRLIPSIEQLRQRARVRALETEYGRTAVTAALREEADELRRDLAAADAGGMRTPAEAAERIERRLEDRLRRAFGFSLRPVINATGVIVHTNLGRAPLAKIAADRVAALATGYTNLEYDIATGGRGRRDAHAEALLCRLTGAAAAVVVNNNAAATLLFLSALAAGREVLISRGELVEIGGGFRIPDVMAQSGAILREVGTTNKTRAADYAAAISDRTALILRVHPSNFRIEGFAERPRLEELVTLGRRFTVPVAEDLGSGYMLPAETDREEAAALRQEPAVQHSVSAGVDIVSFSGDKLLGGPQAGIIVGHAEHVARVRQHPLMRALRVDKLTYAALESTLQEYTAGRTRRSIPVARMIAMTAGEIERRAAAVARSLVRPSIRAEIIDGYSTIGGGSAPGSELPTRLLAIVIEGLTADALEARLRALDPPVIARIEHERVVLDLRTVLEEEDAALARALTALAR